MKRIIVATLATLALMLAPSVLLSGSAAADCSSNGATQQVLNGINQTSDSNCVNAESSVGHAMAAAVNILSILVGAVAIIAIINGGFKYITSGGDATKVANAKHTILYALLGIVIVVLAQLIIRVVITTSGSAAHNCGKNTHYDSASNTCVQN